MTAEMLKAVVVGETLYIVEMFIPPTYFILNGWRSMLAPGYLFVEYVSWIFHQLINRGLRLLFNQISDSESVD